MILSRLTPYIDLTVDHQRLFQSNKLKPLIRFCALLNYLKEILELNAAVYVRSVRMYKIQLGGKLHTLFLFNSIYS